MSQCSDRHHLTVDLVWKIIPYQTLYLLLPPLGKLLPIGYYTWTVYYPHPRIEWLIII